MSSGLNVLIYNGSGVSAASRDNTLIALRAFLSHRYDVQLVSPKTLRQEPWTDSCALLVFPGGRDLPYQFDLQGRANERIRVWVEGGGKYVGFCAGAYYAARRVEFEVGTPLEVVGERELGFFPGACRGTAFPGFEYGTSAGARECRLVLDRTAWRDHWSASPEEAVVWYNGGGAFFLDEGQAGKGVTVLGRYDELEGKPAAGVRCDVGKGRAVLWAVHPEHPAVADAPAVVDPEQFGRGGVDSEDFAERSRRGLEVLSLQEAAGPATATSAEKSAGGPTTAGAAQQSNNTSRTISAYDYATKETRRLGLLRATLAMLELDVADTPAPPPQLLPLFLTAADAAQVTQVVTALTALGTQSAAESGATDILERHDHFQLHPAGAAGRLLAQARARPGLVEPEDLHRAVKQVCAFTGGPPSLALAPLFNVERYFAELGRVAESAEPRFGRVLLYGEAVTSTQTMLDQ